MLIAESICCIATSWLVIYDAVSVNHMKVSGYWIQVWTKGSYFWIALLWTIRETCDYLQVHAVFSHVENQSDT